jgi:hypothetical protein
MNSFTLQWGAIALCFCSATTFAQSAAPMKVSICEIKADPAKYNQKLVEVTGFVLHAFEDFTVVDYDCEHYPEIWLEYGGKRNSDTTYCCGDTAGTTRSENLRVEGIEIPLVADNAFETFNKSIQPPFKSGGYGAVQHATLVGMFFAGVKTKYPTGEFWGGYGHMGCCSLLAIEQVVDPDTTTHPDLDYGAEPEQPDIAKRGCGYKFLTSLENGDNVKTAQAKAETGSDSRVFDDPQRVATEGLARATGRPADELGTPQLIKSKQGRRVFKFTTGKKADSFMVVVSKPYMLLFTAKDSGRIAWVVIAAYQSSCGKENSVTRLR